MTDFEIIDMYWNRNEDAIKETSSKYGAYCNKIAYNILSDNGASEECVNDTYLRIWNDIPPTIPKIFSAYIGKITRNIAINIYYLKKAKKRGEGNAEVVIHELEECISTNVSVEDELQEKQFMEKIDTFLGDLEKSKRVIFVRRYWYADSIEQISDRFGIGESKVKSILFRGRKKLRTFLEEEGIEL